jgi:hypothetical protein
VRITSAGQFLPNDLLKWEMISNAFLKTRPCNSSYAAKVLAMRLQERPSLGVDTLLLLPVQLLVLLQPCHAKLRIVYLSIVCAHSVHDAAFCLLLTRSHGRAALPGGARCCQRAGAFDCLLQCRASCSDALVKSAVTKVAAFSDFVHVAHVLPAVQHITQQSNYCSLCVCGRLNVEMLIYSCATEVHSKLQRQNLGTTMYPFLFKDESLQKQGVLLEFGNAATQQHAFDSFL